MAKKIPLEHPGIILQEEFIEALDLSAYAVSKGTGISQTAIGQIVRGKRNISPVNALKLAKYFGVSEDYFSIIQVKHDLELAKEKTKKPLAKIIPFKKTAVGDNELLEA